MAFVTPTDVTVGSVLTASKYNQEVVENTIELRATHADARNRLMVNTNTFTLTSYADFPNATDKAALDMTFVKELASTTLLVAVYAQAELGTGAAQNIFAGIRIAGTDYDVARGRFLAATSRFAFSGTRAITGVAAGSLTILPRVKLGAGSSSLSFFPDDYLHYSVMEIRT
jgi:hypothetical protein